MMYRVQEREWLCGLHGTIADTMVSFCLLYIDSSIRRYFLAVMMIILLNGSSFTGSEFYGLQLGTSLFSVYRLTSEFRPFY